MPVRNLNARVANVEQWAIVLWQAEARRAAAHVAARSELPAYAAVLEGIDRVLEAIVDGRVSAIGSGQVAGRWYYALRPWHCTPLEAEALRPWCDWIMSAIHAMPQDDQPNSASSYAAWIVANRDYVARRAAYGDDDAE